MSIEADSHKNITTSAWMTHLDVERNASMNTLKRVAEDTFSPFEHLPWGFFGSEPVYINLDLNEEDETREEWDELGREHFGKSKLFKKSDIEQRTEMIRAWRDPAYWVYASEPSTDGLWDQDTPTYTYAVDRMSRFVLSGLFGEQLLRDNKHLRKLAAEFQGTILDRAVLVGGAALAASSEYSYRHEVGGTYQGKPTDWFIPETWTGGDFHGDFRTRRHMRPIKEVVTSLNPSRLNHFMPVVGEGRAGAYHGAEPDVVAALLYYQVAYQGLNPEDVRGRLLKSLSNYPLHVGGNFGDYGDSSGARQKAGLRRRLQSSIERPEYGEALFNGTVEPQAPHRFEVIAEEAGVRLANVDGDGTIYNSITLPAGEIEEYLVTLIRGGGGRTSPQTMIHVIDGLVEE